MPYVTRYWCPHDGTFHLDERGYLADPDSTFLARSLNRMAAATERLAAQRCLVLLGEPGAGKTTALDQHAPLLLESVEAQVLRVPLGLFGSEDRLFRELLDSDQVRRWVAGEGQLCIVADGFDEGAARLPNLALLFADRIAHWPTDRLWLRLACRTADWPTSLGNALRARFEQVALMELLPLRRQDVAVLAAGWGAGAGFLEAVETARVVPLASRPLTLRLLATAFAGSGTLPRRGVQLFRLGLTALAEEQNDSRLDTGLGGALSAAERIAIAGRVAAASIFGGRPIIWTGPASSPDRDVQTDIAIDELAVGAEPLGDSATVNLSREAIREAVATGLFSSRGDQRLGWSHATFADYLAAHWLMANHVSVDQARSLFLAPDGLTYPQTRLVAAWALAIDPGAYEFLAAADPEALRGEVDLPGDGIRSAVIDGLFNVAAAGRLRDRWGTDYDVLCHEAIADQLRPRLASSEKAVRRLALRLAAVCRREELRDDLVRLTLDTDSSFGDRVSAGWAVIALNETRPGDDLLPLVTDVQRRGDDPDDELLGIGLRASWPHALATDDVFHHIGRPKAPDLYGMYFDFIVRFASHLTAEDLGAALGWLEPLIGTAIDDRRGPLVNAALKLAVANHDDHDALDAAARFAVSRAPSYEGFYLDEHVAVTDDPLDDATCRRALLNAVLAKEPDDSVVYALADTAGGHNLGIVRHDDLAWLADEYEYATPERRSRLAPLFGMVFVSNRLDHLDVVFDMPSDHPLYRDLVGAWIAPMALDDPDVIALQGRWRTTAARRRQNSGVRDEIDDMLSELLERFEGGDAVGFWHGVRLLYVSPGGRRFVSEFDPDVTQTQRWSQLSAADQQRWVLAAKRYLLLGECEPEKWLGQQKHHYPSMAGYRAMVLLLRRDPTALQELPSDVWREWAPAIIDWTVTVNGAQWEDKEAILDRAAGAARLELVEAIVSLVRAADERDNHVFLRREVNSLWDVDLGAQLLTILRDATSPNVRDEVAQSMADCDIALVRPTLLEWLEQKDEARDRAVLAAALLVDHDFAASWSHVRTPMDSDATFADAVLAASGVVRDRRTPPVGPRVLADLYVWLVEHFPQHEDCHQAGAHFVGSREEVGLWRDHILEALRSTGTPEGVDAVRELASRLPTITWLGTVQAAAEEALRQAQWHRTDLDDLRRIAADRSARLVTSEGDLSVVIEAALTTIQHRLQGDTPEAPQLWDTVVRRPKEEDALSDYLCNRLNDLIGGRGVVANREVQIRRNHTSGIGERVDLQVDAIAADSGRYRTVTVPIEVKGAWNTDLDTAMSEQLVGRYLADLHTRHGIYAVGWFDPEWWDSDAGGLPGDRRRARVVARGRRELRRALAAQATELANLGYDIRVVILDCSFRRPR